MGFKETPRGSGNRGHLAEFFRLFRQASIPRAQLAVLLFLSLCVATVGVIQPWPIKLLIDCVLGSVPLPAGIQAAFHLFAIPTGKYPILAVIAIGSVAVFIISFVFSSMLVLLRIRIERRARNTLSGRVFARLQDRSHFFHKGMNLGELYHRVVNDSAAVFQMTETLLVQPCGALFKAGLMLVLIAQFNVGLAAFATAVASPELLF